jgi:hypothetical protein
MSNIREFTIEELAEDAFLKNEYLQAQMMMNTPVDYDLRKKAFINLAKAKQAANEAQKALNTRVNNGESS